MFQKDYLCRLKIDDTIQSQLWDGYSEVSIGTSLGWKMLPSENDGLIIFRHKSGYEVKAKSSNQPKNLKLAFDPIGKEAKEKKSFEVQLIPISPSSAAFTHSEASASELQIFCCQGNWIKATCHLEKKYTAVENRKNKFTLERTSLGYGLMASVDGLQLQQNGRVQILSKGERLGLLPIELTTSVISLGSTKWHFRSHSINSGLKFDAFEDINEENIWFRKTFKQTSIAMSLLLLLAVVTGHRSNEKVKKEKKAEKFVKIILPKKREILEVVQPEKVADKSAGSLTATKKFAQDAKLIEKVLEAMVKEKTPVVDPRAGMLANTKAGRKNGTKIGNGIGLTKKQSPSQKLVEARRLRNSLNGLVSNGTVSILASNLKTSPSSQTNFTGSQRFMSKSGLLASPGDGRGGFSRPTLQVGFAEGKGGRSEEGVSYGTGIGATAKSLSDYTATGNGKGGSYLSVDAGDEGSKVSEGGLTQQEIWDVVRKNLSEISHCYTQAKKRRPGLEGTLFVDFRIVSRKAKKKIRGGVKRAKVNSSTYDYNPLDSCVLDRVKTWRFPRPRGDQSVEVTFPFTFRRL